MIPYERRLQILDILETKEVANLDDFLQMFADVSESTIRRDLKTLAAEGQVTLMHGGGVRLKADSYEAPVDSKKVKQIDEKERIAKYAASLVEDGDSIYLDSGSTTLGMVKYLKKKKITIVTSNALIFPELQGTELDCYVVGGELNVSTASILGTTTNNTLMSTFFDKAFLGASAFSERAGVSTPDIREAEKKRIVRDKAEQTFILADSSKAGKNTLCRIFDLGEVTLICDKELPMLEQSGNYIVAGKEGVRDYSTRKLGSEAI